MGSVFGNFLSELLGFRTCDSATIMIKGKERQVTLNYRGVNSFLKVEEGGQVVIRGVLATPVP